MLWPVLIIFTLVVLLLSGTYFWLQTVSTPTRETIIAGIVANIITTSTLTLFGVGTFISIFIFERQQLFHFFGISKNRRTIHIYTSRLEVLPGGTTAAESITRGYVGPAIIRIEYLGALLVRHLFGQGY